MKKVRDLIGRELDRWAAKSNETPWRKPTHGTCCTCQQCGWPNDGECKCDFSTDWSQGGPLLERFGIEVERWADEVFPPFMARIPNNVEEDIHQSGETYLIAGMRCLVASRYGDEVEES